MSVIDTYISKTVKLAPGESFILPPNSNVISMTGALTSTCDNLPIPEDLNCYLFVIAVGDHDNSDTILWDAANFRVKGWRYNGVDYDDMNEGTTGAAGALSAEVLPRLLQNSADSHSILISDIKFGFNSGDGDNGTHNFIVFKTTPTVASKLEMKIDTGASYVNGDDYVPSAYLKPLLLSAVTGLSGVPSCS